MSITWKLSYFYRYKHLPQTLYMPPSIWLVGQTIFSFAWGVAGIVQPISLERFSLESQVKLSLMHTKISIKPKTARNWSADPEFTLGFFLCFFPFSCQIYLGFPESLSLQRLSGSAAVFLPPYYVAWNLDSELGQYRTHLALVPSSQRLPIVQIWRITLIGTIIELP